MATAKKAAEVPALPPGILKGDLKPPHCMAETAKGIYQNWCMSCCGTFHAIMLTGYCLSSAFDGVVWHCDRCGNAADLAMVKVREEK